MVGYTLILDPRSKVKYEGEYRSMQRQRNRD
jgi:hypothetical protein